MNKNNKEIFDMLENLEREQARYKLERENGEKWAKTYGKGSETERNRIEAKEGKAAKEAKEENKVSRIRFGQLLDKANKGVADVGAVLGQFAQSMAPLLPIRHQKEENVKRFGRHIDEGMGAKWAGELAGTLAALPLQIQLVREVGEAWKIVVNKDARWTAAEAAYNAAMDRNIGQKLHYEWVKKEEGRICDKLADDDGTGILAETIELVKEAQVKAQWAEARRHLGELETSVAELRRDLERLGKEKGNARGNDLVKDFFNFITQKDETPLWATEKMQGTLKAIDDAIGFARREMGMGENGKMEEGAKVVDKGLLREVDNRGRRQFNAHKGK